MMPKPIPCTMCGQEAVAFVKLSHGCVCRPDDRFQNLCEQHVHRCTPLGTMAVTPLYGMETASPG